ncbi:uncharacterized protein CcaverHIS019_0207080 [Cutaneotrichosporon cavernicola]|uniref:FAD/NAD(P)-binding domain-containing protein n=1 Tax=Cutaneotrichosporon cavernicola TaxID=279322 RepID=A0AA48L030_9TREE|nr:uncharacterized protein CcaverHIS019_0207080 [Cutaneotrichosporon cavernicola]BEI89346.1 hypothetical protein CcaverHIS019_0207080 [Cutaneotrichosporon cavernicola]
MPNPTLKAMAWPIAVGEGPSILIVGAGMGGLCLALDLDRRGLTNWMGMSMRHSAHLNPAWSETHPERAEIQHYWEALARTEGLWHRVKLQYTAVRAEWDADETAYYVTMHDHTGEEHVYRADILINATGMLSTPRRIELPGADRFEGTILHASDWPEDLRAEQLRGKKVVVVGNGCSGVQIVGELGVDPDIEITSVAEARQWFIPSPKERLLAQWRMDAKFYWYKTKEGASDRQRMEEGIGAWMRKTLPEYMRHTVPEYSFGARRLIYEDGYFAALNSGHARFIEGRVVRVTPTAAVLDDGREIPANYIVLATGFDAEATALDVVGDTDATSNYKSRSDWTMYRGIAMPGIPNYFTVFGNNMYLNHISVSSVLEIQAAYIARIIAAMRDYSVRKLSVKPTAAAAYEAWLEARLRLMAE